MKYDVVCNYSPLLLWRLTLAGIVLKCSTYCIIDVLSGLIWIKTTCKCRHYYRRRDFRKTWSGSKLLAKVLSRRHYCKVRRLDFPKGDRSYTFRFVDVLVNEHAIVLSFACRVNFNAFCICWFFQLNFVYTFYKVSISLELSGLIWVLTTCKGYQKTTYYRVKVKVDLIFER